MRQTKRHLKISIVERVTPGREITRGEEYVKTFKGAIACPTKLEVNYDRHIRGDGKCAEPLDAVYIDSLVEALALIISKAVSNVEDIPILSSMVFHRLGSRVQAMSSARFPDIMARLHQQVREVMSDSSDIGERRRAYAEYFQSQLSGEEKPCLNCEKTNCDFRGRFDKNE